MRAAISYRHVLPVILTAPIWVLYLLSLLPDPEERIEAISGVILVATYPIQVFPGLLVYGRPIAVLLLGISFWSAVGYVAGRLLEARAAGRDSRPRTGER